MAGSFTSPVFSPQSFALSPSSMQPSNNPSRTSSVLPLQPPVSSASVVPQSVRNNSATGHISSNQYIEQHRSFMEHQRLLHEEERALWEIERRELHLRVHELEDMVRKLGGKPVNTFGAAGGQAGRSGPQSTSKTTHQSTGDEFWRGAGGMSDAHPTRSFSDSSDRSQSLSSGPRHLASIAEDLSSQRKSVGFAGMEPLSPPGSQDFFTHPVPGRNVPHGISTIPGDRISASLDGITLKAAGLPPTIAKQFSSNSGSPSPLGTPASHSIASTHTSGSASNPQSTAPRPSVISLTSSGLTAEDLRSKDAGHTPLARLAAEDDSAPLSSQDTPVVKVGQTEESLPDPAPSRLRQPLERSDSYFPAADNARHERFGGDKNEDPALTGPLNLYGDPKSKENDQFLSQLDSKLLQASNLRSNSLDTTSDTSADTELRRIRSAEGDRPTSKGEDRPSFINDEPEPRLRMKRSTNFGSAFGAKPLGF
jgi:hypothetical protein